MDQKENEQGPEEQEGITDFIERKISEMSDLQLRYTYSNASSTSEFSMYENNADQFEAKFVRDDQLYSQMMQKVAHIKTIIWIEDEDVCLYIYHYYQWNEQKLTTSYFKDDWKLLKDKEAQYHTIKTLEGKEAICPVCLEHNLLYSSGMCQHSYCRSCWSAYIKAELARGHIFFPCMHENPCQRSPVLKRFIDLVAPELSELYRKKICINYSIQDKDICFCANDKCSFFCAKPSMMELQTVSCPCGQIYCYRCRQEPHQPASCSEVIRWQRMINSEETNSSWITNHTKECPRCKQPIQKKVGCSHMRCLCQCEFCYECNRLWDQLHVSAKTECPHRKLLHTKEKKQDRCAELDAKLVDLVKQAQKNRTALVICEQLVPDEVLKTRVIYLRKQVVSAWMTIKWTKILLYMEGLPEIEQELQLEYIDSIRNVMEPIEIIQKGYKNLVLKDLHYYGELVLLRMQMLKKNAKIWLQAWQASH